MNPENNQNIQAGKSEAVASNNNIGESKYLIYIGLYIVCIIFVSAGAVNSGFSKFFWAIPFMITSLYVSLKKIESVKLFIFSILFIIASITVNLTQEKNPILFPILSGGTVEFLEDGYIRTFDMDGSGGFVTKEEKEDPDNCRGCGALSYKEVRKGEVLPILKVTINHPSMATAFSLLTEKGQIDRNDYEDSAVAYLGKKAPAKINKNITNKYAQYLSALMYYSASPIYIISLLSGSKN